MRFEFSPEFYKPLEYLNPLFHMSPFSNEALEENRKLLKQTTAVNPVFLKLFPFHPFSAICFNAREAIHKALAQLRLQSHDEVWIVTTTGGSYISGCVTSEVEKFCKWSLVKTEKTRVVFVIHEFGKPCERIFELKKLGLPLIEDCAYSWGSHFANGTPVGSVGDFSIFSFSKAYPVPFGGLLTSFTPVSQESKLTDLGRQSLVKLVNHYSQFQTEYCQSRVEKYRLYQEHFESWGLKPYFSLSEGFIPTAFIFRWHDEDKLKKLKSLLNAAGIESSVYYNMNGYFLPCHYRLTDSAMDFILQNCQWNLKQVGILS